MRNLTQIEIQTLQNQRCTAENWERIEVAENFSAEYVQNVQFSGHNQLGKFGKIFKLENGIVRHSGIFNATLHNCVIENDVYISNIHNVIANYEIKKGCFLTNIGTLSTTRGTTFGNGVVVAAVNENGGRNIPIFEELSAQIAHILVFYRQHQELLEKIYKQIEKNCDKQKKLKRGIISEQVKIMNCKAILNVKIGAGATVSGAELLKNGTIRSDIDAQTLVGAGVIAKDFIFGKSSKITDGVLIERCFVGEGCMVSKQFSATDCLFFANCEMMNGEAVSVFAAPYSVSHHKSSLLIANALAFSNVGSGTNMSNHAYKLGAVHQSVTERGCKFGSNSYLILPAHIGAYTTILGAHKNHPNIANLPFSYLMEENGQSILIPAVNIFRIGTLRDVEKWQKRDRRQGKNHLDKITFDFLNPVIINKIIAGIEILQNLKNEKPDAEFYHYGNCKIHRHSLKRGIEYYQDAITIFLGDYLILREEKGEIKKSIFDFSEWFDMAGLILPKAILGNIWHYMLSNRTIDFQYVGNEFLFCQNNYEEFRNDFIDNYFVEKNLIQTEILQKYISILKTLEIRLKKEANIEFFGDSKISYGIDFEQHQDYDFEQVRGNVEKNSFLKNLYKNFEEKIEKAEKLLCF